MIRVIGCGNPEAGDDAAGLVALRRARQRLAGLPDVEVASAGSGAHALDLVAGADAVVVVDAVRTPEGARTPGTVIRADVGPDGLPVEVSASLSSHGLGLADVLAINRAVGNTPRVVFVGVEGRDMVQGRPMSPAVRAAIPELVDRIVIEARGLRANGPLADGGRADVRGGGP